MRAMPSATTASSPDLTAMATVRGVVQSIADDKIVLSLPHTDYQLHLVPTVPAAAMTTPIGKRVKGTIHAKALRIFKAEGGGGGQFIEPLEGAPRIVAGRVLHVDQPNRRLLVDMAVPVWVTLVEGQPADMFAAGDMVNCYVESGTRFTPV
jgi:hypothetical protein